MHHPAIFLLFASTKAFSDQPAAKPTLSDWSDSLSEQNDLQASPPQKPASRSWTRFGLAVVSRDPSAHAIVTEHSIAFLKGGLRSSTISLALQLKVENFWRRPIRDPPAGLSSPFVKPKIGISWGAGCGATAPPPSNRRPRIAPLLDLQGRPPSFPD
ncbi:hypothetical protein RJ035_002385 [Blastomyces gilchristii]